MSRFLPLSLILVACAIFPSMSFANYSISDADVNAGEIITLYISTDDTLQLDSSIEVNISFPNRSLAYIGYVENQQITQPNIQEEQETNQNNLSISGIIENPEAENLLALQFRTLVGGGESAEVIINSISVQGVPISESEIEPIGNVNIIGGDIIIIEDRSDISPAYPNPFRSSVKLKFSIAEKTNVHFDIYSITGRLLDRIPNIQGQSVNDGFFDYLLLGDIQTSDWKTNPSLEKGNYTLELYPQVSQAVAGQYFLVMHTNDISIGTAIMYIK